MIYRGLGTLLVLAYSVLMLGGFDLDHHGRSDVPLSMRQSPGGYRSWSFWHSGLHGGK